jgi:hypothetical protein
MNRRDSAAWCACGFLAFLWTCATAAAGADLGEGTDLEIGGPGKGHGKFFQVVDITFDSKNHIT